MRFSVGSTCCVAGRLRVRAGSNPLGVSAYVFDRGLLSLTGSRTTTLTLCSCASVLFSAAALRRTYSRREAAAATTTLASCQRTDGAERKRATPRKSNTPSPRQAG